MKTLSQIEPRTDVLSLPGDANNQHIISAPGSYYLSDNLMGVAGQHGISVQSTHVTIDLSGFTLIAASGTSTNGIDIPAGVQSIVIRNGALYGWHRAMSAEKAIGGVLERLVVTNSSSTGVFAGQAWAVKDCVFKSNGASGVLLHDNSQITDSLAKDNTNVGIIVNGNGALIARCSAYGNQSAGIDAQGVGSTIVDCTAQANAGGGIVAFGNATISRCVADQNGAFGVSITGTGVVSECTATRSSGGGDGFHSNTGEVMFSKDTAVANEGLGFNAQTATNIPNPPPNAGNVFRDCIAAENNGGGIAASLATVVEGCAVWKNSGNSGAAFGVSVGDSSHLVDNSVRENDNDGIRITAGCYARNNTCDYNGRAQTGGAAGMLVTGPQNRIDGNNLTSNINVGGIGLKVTSGGNLIVRNSARTNVLNYSIAPGNNDAAIVTPGSAFTSASPWANFSY